MSICIYHPTHRGHFVGDLLPNQRYRNNFGDERLSRRHITIQTAMSTHLTCCSQELSGERRELVGLGRFLNNDSVSVVELINLTTTIDPASISGKDLIVPMDNCDVNLALNGRSRRAWSKTVGVSGGGKAPGLQVMPALVIERQSEQCLGLADILLHGRPQVSCGKKENKRVKKAREKLPFYEKESACWSQVAVNTSLQLRGADRVTFLMDQGGDVYENMEQILNRTGRDFIVRVNHNRKCVDLDSGQAGTFDSVLATTPWLDNRLVDLRALDHVPKTNGRQKIKKRQGRTAKMNLRAVRIHLDPPYKYPAHLGRIETPLYLIEVMEDPSTVPTGEKPVHWRLLTSWENMDIDNMWEAVDAYRCRWHIEQVFRVLKKQGLEVDQSQVDTPEAFKKLLIMALKVAADAIRLTNARSGEHFVDINEMFTAEQSKVLSALNKRYSGRTKILTNPHASNSLAYAAWVIARMGGWDGYAHRLPGPVRMMRGLREFYRACRYADLHRDM